MNPTDALPLQIEAACEQACAAIAPAWPLDRAIAVNPHWGRIGQPLRTVAARLAVLGGVRVLPPRALVREAWASGRVTRADLEEAIERLQPPPAAGLDADACVAALAAEPSLPRLPLLIDLLDAEPNRHHRLPWRDAVTHQISQTCAAYFDRHQADWQPRRDGGLYAFWRETLLHDHGIGTLMGLPRLGASLAHLPPTPTEAERWVLGKLGLPPARWADYLEALLLTVNGWASYCAYLDWQARLAGGRDPHLRELLALRLAWGAILLEGDAARHAQAAFAGLHAAWSQVDAHLAAADAALRVDEIWQTALDIGYQRTLLHTLRHGGVSATPQTPTAQAVFCIDVRSERLRRALEATAPHVQTLGFAGFFGLPIAYTPIGTPACRPQLPGLLAPALEVTDAPAGATGTVDPPADVQPADVAALRQRALARADQRGAGAHWPLAAFPFVEAAGWLYGGALLRWLRPPASSRPNDDAEGLPARLRPVCRPVLSGLPVEERIALAARVLRAMGLHAGLAPLVALVGHGSQSANNPHVAALDCGACGGQTGEVNARVLARLLNDPAVRAGLPAHGITVPASTVFVAALHNTTTDEVEWFDTDLLPAPSQGALGALQAAFVRAAEAVRRERAPTLDLPASTSGPSLARWLRRRASDGAQTRPEWGLAGNAAFLIAPRSLTRGQSLDGRVFLHDYDAAQDTDGSLLELLMTAPMLVTHWINWQYHASQCEPRLYGSGNKVLHNVVGGVLGVFEGNGGDLRIGLARQSLHDGQRWMHEPLRLTVVIAAPAARIEAVIERHTTVRHLVEHGWLHLWRLDADTVYRYAAGQWHALPDVRR